MKRTLREIEEINNPRPMVFIGDVIIRSVIYTTVGAVAGLVGWLALVGLDRIFQVMGI